MSSRKCSECDGRSGPLSGQEVPATMSRDATTTRNLIARVEASPFALHVQISQGVARRPGLSGRTGGRHIVPTTVANLVGLFVIAASALLAAQPPLENTPEPQGPGNQDGRPQDNAPLEPWKAARVEEVLGSLRGVPVTGRELLLPTIAGALRSYRKSWQGTRQEQLRFESAYCKLATLVTTDFRKHEEAALAKAVVQASSDRMRYLQDPEALRTDIQKAWGLLVAQEYGKCVEASKGILDAAYDRVPAVELAVGVCEMNRGDTKGALAHFRQVLELKQGQESQTGAAAAFLAAHALLCAGRLSDALQVLRALQRDYPSGAFAKRARDMLPRLARMGKELDVPKQGDAIPRPGAPEAPEVKAGATSVRLLDELLRAWPAEGPATAPGKEKP